MAGLVRFRPADRGATTTHLLAGGGGDTLGFWLAGFNPAYAANHNQTCMDTHAANFPQVEHRTADVSNIDFRSLPRTVGLWGSPICQESSPAGGRKRRRTYPGQLALLEYGPVESSIWEKTRYTAYEILRAVEVCGYDFVACENVVEFATDWPLFGWWLQAMGILGYRATVCCVSSAHIGDQDNPYAPQWRDRFYVVFTRTGIPAPDLTPRPAAWCANSVTGAGCGELIEAVQWWKEPARNRIAGHLIGKYRQQYLYRSPHVRCGRPVVEPFVAPAATAIDFTDVGQRIGDRIRPLAEATRRRIEIGLARYGGVQTVVTVNHGGGDPRAYLPNAAPMATRTSRIGDGLLTPPLLVVSGGNWAEAPMSVAEPMRTRTANPKGFETLVCPAAFVAELRRHGTARSVTEPLATITAGGTHHALVVPYYRTGVAKTTAAPLDTITTDDRFALVSGKAIEVDDCHLRMVQPRESLRGQAFPDWYVVKGNKGQQTAQAGNAVSVNVARWVGDRILAALDSRSAS